MNKETASLIIRCLCAIGLVVSFINPATAYQQVDLAGAVVAQETTGDKVRVSTRLSGRYSYFSGMRLGFVIIGDFNDSIFNPSLGGGPGFRLGGDGFYFDIAAGLLFKNIRNIHPVILPAVGFHLGRKVYFSIPFLWDVYDGSIERIVWGPYLGFRF